MSSPGRRLLSKVPGYDMLAARNPAHHLGSVSVIHKGLRGAFGSANLQPRPARPSSERPQASIGTRPMLRTREIDRPAVIRSYHRAETVLPIRLAGHGDAQLSGFVDVSTFEPLAVPASRGVAAYMPSSGSQVCRDPVWYRLPGARRELRTVSIRRQPNCGSCMRTRKSR